MLKKGIRKEDGYAWYAEQMVLLMVHHGMKDGIYGFMRNSEERYDLFVDKIYEFLKRGEPFLVMDEMGKLYFLDEMDIEEHLYYPVLSAAESADGTDIIDDVYTALSHIEQVNANLVDEGKVE